MNELDNIYLWLLRCGVVAIRNSACGGHIEHCKKEAEHLHNLPGLIGQSIGYSHIFYATKERLRYLKWARQYNREEVNVLITFFYAAKWKEMDAILGTESPPELTELLKAELSRPS
jgi:hypothetical protein